VFYVLLIKHSITFKNYFGSHVLYVKLSVHETIKLTKSNMVYDFITNSICKLQCTYHGKVMTQGWS